MEKTYVTVWSSDSSYFLVREEMISLISILFEYRMCTSMCLLSLLTSFNFFNCYNPSGYQEPAGVNCLAAKSNASPSHGPWWALSTGVWTKKGNAKKEGINWNVKSRCWKMCCTILYPKLWPKWPTQSFSKLFVGFFKVFFFFLWCVLMTYCWTEPSSTAMKYQTITVQ